MKITIEFTGTLDAECTIDDKPFKIKLARFQGMLGYGVDGLTDDQLEQTIGGAIAAQMVGPVSTLMQATAAAMEEGAMLEGEDAWGPVSDAALDAFMERAS